MPQGSATKQTGIITSLFSRAPYFRTDSCKFFTVAKHFLCSVTRLEKLLRLTIQLLVLHVPLMCAQARELGLGSSRSSGDVCYRVGAVSVAMCSAFSQNPPVLSLLSARRCG